jgi:hypothetical protein
MQTTVQTLRRLFLACRPARATIALGLLLMLGFAPSGLAQTGTNPLTIFKNYFVTGDYVVGGWVEASSDGTFATGTISIPDPKKPAQSGLPTTVPVGADIVAAYLYWGTVEGSQSAFRGQQAFFNGYSITGDNLLSPNGTVSWSSGGCIGGSQGSKTMRIYRADVRRYLPVDTNPSSPTFGTLLAGGTDQNPLSISVRMADSGSNGNTQPNALGATLVIIYRVLNPPTPLNAVVLYDGAYAPSNAAPNVSQMMVGFYQPNSPPTAKLTHIVANGQPNKGETVSFVSPSTGSHVLPSLYTAIFGADAPPFPGLYGMWDNPTWSVGSWANGGTSGFDPFESTSVVPASTGSGCVDWGAMIFSTTVQDSDGDGLLDAWETPDTNGNQGYVDAVSNQWVALPGADLNKKDIFVELDYLTDLDGSATQHSHLPKQAALDAVGGVFANQNINVHFDLGPGIYQGDPYVITYPVPIPAALPPGVSPPPAGTGGNAISEGTLLCTDDGATPPLCAFPGQPAVGWKGDFLFVKDTATMPGTNPPVSLGNFQPGRRQSYHYVLFGHSLGEPRSFWSAYGAKLADPTIPQLVSIQNTGNTAKVTIQSLQVLSPLGVTLYPKPGDCPNPLIPACSDLNSNRVTITGALGQPNPAPGILSPQNLNATYLFTNPVSTTTNNITTTTFNIATSGVPDGTYNFGNEPELGVAYLGPTSSSGHSDFGGGGDSAVTFGLWGADDPIDPITQKPTCQPDPTQPPGSGYCNNQVGTTAEQTGTLLHELGHSLTLTHGGTYYTDPINPSLPSYEMNCKPNFLSTMSYLFQVRGFVDNKGFDYSGQTMPPLNEATPSLSEASGIGADINTGAATHLTRWYSAPNALDNQLQATTGGRYAKSHCDGTPIVQGDPSAVRVDGALASGGTYSAPLDWNNDLTVPDAINAPGVDLNYNAITGDSPFSGLNEWQVVNPTPASNGVALQQIGARGNAFAFSGGGGTKFGTSGGTKFGTSGGIDFDGGSGTKFGTSGGTKFGTSGGTKFGTSGGVDQNEDTAASTVDPPSGLTCSIAQGNVPACVSSSPPTFTENAKMVPLSWTLPGSTQIRFTYVYRAVGSFPTTQQVMANFSKFTIIKTLSGSPPAQTYTDPNVKNSTTYTYFVTDKNKQGALSGASTPLVVFVKF